MKFEKFQLKKHNSRKVSELIYEADRETFNFFFKNKFQSSQNIEKLVIAGGNVLGHQQIYVITDENGQLQGVMVFAANKIDKKTELKVLYQNLNIIDFLKFAAMEMLDNIFLADLNDGDYYFAVIAVDEELRGRGIGSFILEEGIKLARARRCKRAVLDVDIKNKDAIRFYERFGFKKFNKKSLNLFGWERGVYNMELRF